MLNVDGPIAGNLEGFDSGRCRRRRSGRLRSRRRLLAPAELTPGDVIGHEPAADQPCRRH